MQNRKTLEEITKTCIADNPTLVDSRMCIIDAELRRGFEMMNDHPRSVSIFGSARLLPETDYYKRTEALAKKIANMNYTVVTGGGHGIMGAANKGAFEAEHGASVGINIELPFEQTLNPSLDDSIEFHHFFSRKVILAYSAEAYIYCPGGFGTLDEFFEVLTLMQTKKIPKTPIILYGSEFWQPLEDYFKTILLKSELETISREDLDLYTITDDDEEVLRIIKEAEVRTDISSTHHLGSEKSDTKKNTV
ncbi:TIGR00730 family Rossman fold protein [Candidatus Campbellbacteria bacterium]|nr:TIGR00730 family Rossman fold protein [Candidatus Campbellbacteria bacterium]|tara:strand:- start:321 stop:1067 length:747 start_codon:yes stop_codon:yes gene_type:complete